MKSKMLFVMPHMGLGGAARALVTLLHSLDYDKCEVDLLLFHGKGFNLNYLPEQVNVIGPITEGNEYYLRFKQLVLTQMKKGHFWTVARKIFYAIKTRLCGRKNFAVENYYNWQFIRPYIAFANKEYDVAVGYLDGTAHYYVIDKVQAKKKVCWVHNDYSKMDTYKKNIKYLKRADVVATISPGCLEELRKFYPLLDNLKLVYNLNSPSLINRMAEDALGEDFAQNDGEFRILSIGRLVEQKAYHLAIDAAKILKDKGYKFNWGIIGNGVLKDELTAQIEALGVSDVIHLLGLKENPYPYVKAADIIVQCSIYEGKSIALDEAKIMGKAIVCTNYNSAKDQIEDGVTGLLVPITAEGVASGIERLFNNPELIETLTDNLKCFEFDQAEAWSQHEDVLSLG